MLIHLFNSGSISGPEQLVIPALKALKEELLVVFLVEKRLGEAALAAPEFARVQGLQVATVKVEKRYDLAAIRELVMLLKKFKPKIVHAHDVKASYYLLAAKQQIAKPGFRLVSTHHGVRGRSGFKPKFYEKLYTHLVLPSFDLVLAVCSSDQKALISRGLRQEKVKLHLNGVSREALSVDKRKSVHKASREKWGLAARGVSDDAFIIGYAGRLSTEKGVDRILNVLAALKAIRPELVNWHFLCFGEGDQAESLKALSGKLGLDDRGHFMGYRQDIALELAGLDLLMLLSPAEGLPVVLLEAAWSLTPVFVNGVDGVNDLIPSEEFGNKVDPELSDMELAKRLAETISDTSEDLSKQAKCLQARVAESFSETSWLNSLKGHYESLRPSPK